MSHVGGGLDLLELDDGSSGKEDEEGDPLEEGELLLEHGHREEGCRQDFELVQDLCVCVGWVQWKVSNIER